MSNPVESPTGFSATGYPLARAPRPARVRILVEGRPEDCRVAILEDGKLVEFIPSQHEGRPTTVGNVYLGRVSKLAPGVEAAFVDIGASTDAFLPESEWPEKGLRAGETHLVQVQKDAVGEKGARVSCHLALAGRNVVLLPGGDRVRISRRIPQGEERVRLQALGTEVLPDGCGLIIRTASVAQNLGELGADIEALELLDKQIRAKARVQDAPALVHREPGPAARVVRDHLTEEVEAVVAANRELASEVRSAVFSAPASLLERIRVKSDPFREAGVERELTRCLSPRVQLRSGGHVVIEPTEALVAVDVNSGGSKGGPDLEATALQTNLEAAEVVSRQLRLRDLGGIIVIDFIDLGEEAHRKQVEDCLEECMSRDRGNPKLHGWSDLGLMVISRRRRRMPLYRMLQRPCPTCRGRARVDASGRVVERAAGACRAWLANQPGRRARVRLHPDLIPALRLELEEVLERIDIKGDREFPGHRFEVEEA